MIKEEPKVKNKKLIWGSDHAGYELKEKLKSYIEERGYENQDEGTFSCESTDYPDYAHKVSEKVEGDNDSLGILICGSANGVSMAANKHAGIRSAIAWNSEIASLARTHNNANILSLPARYITEEEAKDILEAFLQAEFEGGRHQRRVEKIEIRP